MALKTLRTANRLWDKGGAMNDDVRTFPVPTVTCGSGTQMNHVQRFQEGEGVLDQFICPSCKQNAGGTHDRLGRLAERQDSVKVRFGK
jgi:hypothetical protein